MDLLEYQAKKLFNQVGIPVLPSQPIHDPRELKGLQIPYPVVLKSQVSVGGRGRAGGIRFVENTIDAMAAARTIFHLPILNQYPSVILAEARYNPVEEFFLAIVLDYALQKPVLLGSITGGIEVEKLLENLQKVVIEDDFSSFYARRLVTKMGLKGELIKKVSDIVEKMYYLFLRKDLDLIEINPLGLNSEGELMALDGKISVNDHALLRHPDIIELTHSSQDKNEEEREIKPLSKAFKWVNSVNKNCNIAIISNNLSSALINWDLISQAQGKLAGYYLIWEEYQGKTLPEIDLFNELETAINSVKELPGVEVVLINLIVNKDTLENIGQKLVNYFQDKSENITIEKGVDRLERATGAVNRSRRKNSSKSRSLTEKKESEIQFVLRLVSDNLDNNFPGLDNLVCPYTHELEKAISLTVKLAK